MLQLKMFATMLLIPFFIMIISGIGTYYIFGKIEELIPILITMLIIPWQIKKNKKLMTEYIKYKENKELNDYIEKSQKNYKSNQKGL